MFAQLPWDLLTRSGTEIPSFRAIRRPISTCGTTVAVGDELPADLFPPPIRRARLRQFYESMLIEPAIAPPKTLQEHRDRARAKVAEAQTAILESSGSSARGQGRLRPPRFASPAKPQGGV